MTAPRVEVDLDAIEDNTRVLVDDVPWTLPSP